MDSTTRARSAPTRGPETDALRRAARRSHALPRLLAALQRLRVLEALCLTLFCHTGRAAFARSGAVEDDLLVPGQRRHSGPELGERHRAFQPMLLELCRVVIA